MNNTSKLGGVVAISPEDNMRFHTFYSMKKHKNIISKGWTVKLLFFLIFNCPASVSLYPWKHQIPILVWQEWKPILYSAVLDHIKIPWFVHAFLLTNVQVYTHDLLANRQWTSQPRKTVVDDRNIMGVVKNNPYTTVSNITKPPQGRGENIISQHLKKTLQTII